jgi:hypothetical protein
VDSQRHLDKNLLLLLGIAYYLSASWIWPTRWPTRGWGIFTGYNSDLPTQLWIAARSLQSISLLAARVSARKFNVPLVLSFNCVTLPCLQQSLRVFSRLFCEGQGLTPFKIIC